MNQKIKEIIALITLPYYLFLSIGKKKYYLVCPNGIGEIVTIFMYAKEYIKQNHIDDVTLIINESRKECADALSCNGIYFLMVKSWYHKLMMAFGLSRIGSELIPKNIRFIDDWKRQKRENGNNYSHIIKLMGLKEPICDYSFCKKENRSLSEDIVFFNPYARTIDDVDVEIYEKIVREISWKYTCYTFVRKNQVPIKGTEPLKCTLKNAFEWVSRGKCLIGTRSGFMDLMSLSETKIICLYQKMTDQEEFFSFRYCDWNKCVFEVSAQDVNNVIQKIIQMVEE